MVTVESWETHGPEETCTTVPYAEERDAKRGCKMKDFATIRTPHRQKRTYTGQQNQANFKHTKFTIFHILYVGLFFFFTGLALHWNESQFKKTKCCTKGISCLINIICRI